MVSEATQHDWEDFWYSPEKFGTWHITDFEKVWKEMDQIEHRLYGILNADDPCSVGRWLDLAIKEIQSVWDVGKLPIIVGGTGMYLKALYSHSNYLNHQVIMSLLLHGYQLA